MIKKTKSLAIVTLAGAALVSEAVADTFDRNALEDLAGEPITLSATGAPQRVAEAPVNMTIITQDEIRSSGAIDLPGILERLANVDVMRTSRGMADVSIRGYNTTMSPRLLVLLNGRQVYLDHYGMTNWSAIPVQMAEIRQIEVVSGPNTALFGFNAVAGVINIVTFDALHDDVDALSVTVGEPDYAGAAGVWTWQSDERLGVRLSVGGFDAESTDDDNVLSQGVLGRPARDPASRTVAFNAGYRITPDVRGDVEATYSRDDQTGRFLSSMFAERYETTSLKWSMSAETGLGMLNTQIYHNTLATDNVSIVGLNQQDTHITVAAASLVAKPAAAHTLRGGVEYRHNWLTQHRGDEISYDVYALSGMWDWRATDALSLTAALRVDRLELDRDGPQVDPGLPLTNADYDQSMTEPSYNLGFVYRLTATDALRLSAARGIGSPSLNEYGLQNASSFGPLTTYYSGNPNLGPTKVDDIELGWDHDLGALDGRLRLTAFWQKTHDVRLLGATTIPLSMTTILLLADNIDDSEMTGVEASLDGQAGRLHWNAQYSWRNIDDALTSPGSVTGVGYEDSSPEHVATLGLVWVGQGWEVGGDARYTSDTVQYGLMSAPGSPVPTVETDDYMQLNLHAAWLPRANLRVELSGRDLLEERTQTVGIAPVQRSAYLTIAQRF